MRMSSTGPLPLLLLLAVNIATTDAVTSIVMAPTNAGAATEAALIIVPGASIHGTAYRPLADVIQSNCPLKLWVVLLDGFFANTPNPLQLGGAVTSAISALKAQGMTSPNVFLAGHSLGGVFVGQYAQSNAQTLKGVLLYASYLTKDVSLSSFPLPVLTISGDLDGQTRITRVQDAFEQLDTSTPQGLANKYRTPVITMPGVSHAQFASGAMPSAVTSKDLKPEASAQAAYGLIAQHTSAFLVSALANAVTPAMLSAAHSDLDAAYTETLAIMQPLMTVKVMDDTTRNTDQWAIQAQYMQAGLSKQLVTVTDTILQGDHFLSSKPSVQVSGGSATIATFSAVTYASNLLDISTTPSAPSELAIKMKSFEAVKSVMPQATRFNLTAATITCKDINQAAFALALQKASPVARRRYQSHGRPMTFQDDSVHSTGFGWSGSHLVLHEDDQGMHVTAQALKTGVNMIISSVAGMHYCKALAPYRAMEWIYVDSLRTHA